jgi:Concanavalin A-like lectin/glucanases superfamily
MPGPYTFAGQSSLAGPPVQGNYVLNQLIQDVNGTLWVCTGSGSPGTWAEAGSTALTGPTFTELLSASSGAYDTAVAADSPAAWWKLADASGSGTAADSSGNGYTGTAALVTFGCPGSVLVDPSETSGLFKSSGTTIVSSFNPSGWTALTVEAWINNLNQGQGTTTPRFVANSHTDSADHNGFELQATVSESVPGTFQGQFYVGNGTTSVNSGLTPQNLTPGVWHHLVGTWVAGGNVLLYIDGLLWATSGATLSGTMGTGSAGETGIGYNPTYNGDHFAGLISQVAVYPVALSAARVLAHYQAGAYA